MSEQYVLILGGGLMQRPAVEAAQELGYKALVIDANPDAVCVPFADRFERIDLKDRESIAEFALSLGDSLRAVFTAGTDFSASVSYAAERCGLQSHRFQAALNASNKILMRRCFQKNGIPSPDFFEADESYIARAEKGGAEPVTFPKVVKPVDNMGARGCRLARNHEEFILALREAVRFSRSKKAIVEDYMEGAEFSIDALVTNGTVTVAGFADRHIFFEPYFVELGHTMPSSVSGEQKAQIVRVFSDAVRALGLTDGAAKGDVKYTERGPMIGEIAARLSGGYMSGWTFPYSSGCFLTKEAMKIALGLPPGFSCGQEIPSVRTSCERAFISIPGTVKKIYGEENACAAPFVQNIFFRVKEGSRVEFPRNNVEKCGNVISCSESRSLAVSAAESAAACIVLRLEPRCSRTEQFLSREELPGEQGFPRSAYDFSSAASGLLQELEKNPAVQENESVQECVPGCIMAASEGQRDWNFRTVRQSLALFDRLCPVHPALDARKFWSCLERGGVQGILYYADSAEAADES